MERFDIYRNSFGNWTLIRTGLQSIGIAREELASVVVDQPQFSYKIVKVTSEVILEVPATSKKPAVVSHG